MFMEINFFTLTSRVKINYLQFPSYENVSAKFSCGGQCEEYLDVSDVTLVLQQ